VPRGGRSVRAIYNTSLLMQGWHGWDDYAPFYDWENAQTVGRRDLTFWIDLARRTDGAVLELGCGTGRVSLPVAKVCDRFVGVDRSAPMLRRFCVRLTRAGLGSRAVAVRGDICALPFRKRVRFSLVMAPYGMLQSLLRERDLRAALRSVAAVVPRGGLFVVDLVPDLSRWQEYKRRVSLRGRRPGGGQLTLIETVRQDYDRQTTVFDQEYVEQIGRDLATHRFSIAFRTLTVAQLSGRLERSGFRIDSVLGDYHGRAWSPDADVWVVVARRG
jgi:SAM-dependent methyltransferase